MTKFLKDDYVRLNRDFTDAKTGKLIRKGSNATLINYPVGKGETATVKVRFTGGKIITTYASYFEAIPAEID